MKHIFNISLGLIFTLLSIHGVNPSDSTKLEKTADDKSCLQILDIPNLNEILQGIPLDGTLKFGSDDNEISLLYLKVTDQLFEVLLPFINDEDVEIGSSDLGAHISVMRYSMGDTVENMANLQELGVTYNFKIKYLATVKPDHDIKWERVWLLAVESLELENLRESYGLTPKLHDNQHDFHITIAIKLVQ